MNVESLVEAISAGATGAVVVGTAMRRYWTGRERRQQTEFRRAVQAIVMESTAELAERQRRMEVRQGRHLDHQDQELATLRSMIEKRTLPRHD